MAHGTYNNPRAGSTSSKDRMSKLTQRLGVDPDVRAAKKQIRKAKPGKGVYPDYYGTTDIIDEFGGKHGYVDGKTLKLINSRLVQRKERQSQRASLKHELEEYTGRKKIEEFKAAEPFSDGTIPNDYRKQYVKDRKKQTKAQIKYHKKHAKANRKAARVRNKKNKIDRRLRDKAMGYS